MELLKKNVVTLSIDGRVFSLANSAPVFYECKYEPILLPEGNIDGIKTLLKKIV